MSTKSEDIAALIDRYLGQYCRNTARSYRHDLVTFAETLNAPVASAFEHLFFSTSEAQIELVEKYKLSMADSPLCTFRRRLSVLRSISRFAREEGVTHQEICVTCSVRRSASQIASAAPKRTVELPESAIKKMRATTAKDESTAGRRDLAIFDLLFFRHLEGCEIVNLKKEDVDLPAREIRIPRCRSGPKKQFDLAPEPVASLTAWIDAHPDPATPFLFVRLDRGWQKLPGPMSTQGVKLMLRRRAKECRLDGPITFRGILKASTANAAWRELRQGNAISEVFTFARRRISRPADQSGRS